MCFKLVKQLNSLERLPINHTIYAHLVEKDKQGGGQQVPAAHDPSKFLYS
jgi:hypothetical protein